jgi:hypothetical protein
MIVNVIVFFAIGIILLLALTFTVYRTGIVHKTRDSAGHLRKKQSLSGSIILLIVFVLIVTYFLVFQIVTFNTESKFTEMVLGTSILMGLLLLFDSFFIDLILIGRIRPSFLNLPSQTTLRTMRIHVIKTFTLGWIFIIPIIFVSSLIAYWILK